MKNILTVLFPLISLVCAMSAAASSVEINCPTQVQTSTITNLYSEWSDKPPLESLQRITIEEVNEQRFLTCLYGENQAFKTSRPEPLRKICQIQEEKQNFLCGPTPHRLSGTVVLSDGLTGVDLANGRTRSPFTPDVWFKNTSGGYLSVLPGGTATIKKRRDSPDVECGEPSRLGGEVSVGVEGIRGLIPHLYFRAYIFCVTTNEGRASEFLITESTTLSGKIEVNYKTW